MVGTRAREEKRLRVAELKRTLGGRRGHCTKDEHTNLTLVRWWERELALVKRLMIVDDS